MRWKRHRPGNEVCFPPFPNVSRPAKVAPTARPRALLSRLLLALKSKGRSRVPFGWLPFGEKQSKRRDRQTAASHKKKLMKTKRNIEKQAPANSTPAVSQGAGQGTGKRAFRRQYIVTIEGEPNFAPIGWGDAGHESRHLNSLHALRFIADEVERYYQTTLQDRTVTIEAVK